MRLFPLFIDEAEGEFVQGVNSPAPAQIRPIYARDTLLIAARKLVRPGRANQVYAEKAWDSTAIRASVGLITSGPNSGTFKLKVGDEVSAAISWPADLEAATVAAFKLDALAKLRATTGVGSGAVNASDPAGTPATLLYFTWTGAADERVIEVVESTLAPVVLPKVEIQRGAPGFQQIVRLMQAPIKQSSGFSLVDSSNPAIVEQQAGQAGQNAIQRITISDQALGSVVVRYSGTPTRPMAVPGLTADQLAAALNAIVPGGDIQPSFSVSLVGGTRGTFDIEFIGPLAAEAQDALTVELFAAVPPTTATAELDLTDPRFTAALNGARQVTIQFEFAFIDASGKEASIIRDIVLKADMSQDGDETQLEELGQVVNRTVTIYLNENNATPYVEAAAGVTFTPAGAVAAGQAQSLPHNLDSWRAVLRVTRHIVNHTTFAAAPGDVDAATLDTVPLQEGGEFTYIRTTKNAVEVRLATPLVNDTSSAWDYRLIKFDISSPDAIVRLFTHTHPIADIDELQEALDALAAAIGMVDGSVKFDVKNLIGLIPVDKINLEDLIRKLFESAAFKQSFETLLIEKLESSEYLERLVEAIFGSTTFNEQITTKILEIFGGSDPTGVSVMFSKIPDVTFQVPLPTVVRGPSVTRKVPVETTTETVAGGTTVTTIVTSDKTETVQTETTLYSPLSPTLDDPPAGATVIGLLDSTHAATADPGELCTVGADGAEIAAMGGRDRIALVEGATVIYFNGHWFQVTELVPYLWVPLECHKILLQIPIRETQLAPGNRFTLNAIITTALVGNTTGECFLQIDQADLSEGTTAATLAWETISSTEIQLTDAPTSHRIGITIDNEDGVYDAHVVVYGAASSFSPVAASKNLIFRVKVTAFDYQRLDAGGEKGSFLVNMKNATAAVVIIPD